MGNVCPCPKRSKKKQFAYDVHEETFQMDENIQNIGEHSPKQDAQNNILTDDLRSSDQNQEAHHEREKLAHSIQIPLQQSNQHFQASSGNHLGSKSEQEPSLTLVQQHSLTNEQHSLPLAASTGSIIEKQPLIEPKSAQPKPSFTANILKPKTVKKKYNPDDYRYLNQTGSFRVKPIDSIKEQQYNIDGCRDCSFFVFDITANVYIDDCENCFIFIAPCESTIFIRNCKRVTLVAATKQFRTVQCYDCTFSLYCKSQPVIESSNGLAFTSFKCPIYSELPKQFSRKRLQPWNNHWSEIHNFTKKQGEKHASFHERIQLEVDWKRAFQLAGLEMVEGRDPVPLIVGDLPYQPKNPVFILLHKTVSDDQTMAALQGVPILRGFQGVVAGEGKEEKRAVLIDALDSIPEKYEDIGVVISNPSGVAVSKAKWFISFNDEREK